VKIEKKHGQDGRVDDWGAKISDYRGITTVKIETERERLFRLHTITNVLSDCCGMPCYYRVDDDLIHCVKCKRECHYFLVNGKDWDKAASEYHAARNAATQ